MFLSASSQLSPLLQNIIAITMKEKTKGLLKTGVAKMLQSLLKIMSFYHCMIHFSARKYDSFLKAMSKLLNHKLIFVKKGKKAQWNNQSSLHFIPSTLPLTFSPTIPPSLNLLILQHRDHCVPNTSPLLPTDPVTPFRSPLICLTLIPFTLKRL